MLYAGKYQLTDWPFGKLSGTTEARASPIFALIAYAMSVLDRGANRYLTKERERAPRGACRRGSGWSWPRSCYLSLRASNTTSPPEHRDLAVQIAQLRRRHGVGILVPYRDIRVLARFQRSRAGVQKQLPSRPRACRSAAPREYRPPPRCRRDGCRRYLSRSPVQPRTIARSAPAAASRNSPIRRPKWMPLSR